MCEHLLLYGEEYIVKTMATCDNCGNQLVYENTLMRYVGDIDKKHAFDVISPVSCLGCHATILSYVKICQNINVTKEFDGIKNGRQ